MKQKLWEVVVNLKQTGQAADRWDVLPVELQKKVAAALEALAPPPWKCRFGNCANEEPLVSALFRDIRAKTSLDAQIRADNLVKQCLGSLGGVSLELEVCGVRQQVAEDSDAAA